MITAMSLPFLAKKPIDLPPIVSIELIQITDETNIPFAPKAKKIIALSKMVFPHKIARLILVEQLYRAKCIINRHPYHKT